MTPQQSKLYRWLLDHADDPVGPTFDMMREAMGLRSRAGIHRMIVALEERGLVTRIPNKASSIRAIRKDPLHGVSSAVMIQELKRRGEWPNGH